MCLAALNFHDTRTLAVLLVFTGALATLFSVLSAARTVSPAAHPAPGRAALAHWLPIAAAVLTTHFLGHTALAMGILFGTCVAAFSAVTGFILVAGPVEQPPARLQTLWLFAPVPPLLVFVIGFHGQVGWFDALLLGLQGLLILPLWLQATAPSVSATGFPVNQPVDSHNPGKPDPPDHPVADHSPRSGAIIAIEMTLALLLAIVGAWLATRGAEQLQGIDRRYPLVALGATILSVVLALPMISTGAVHVSAGRGWIPITSQIGIVFLNLALLLPLLIMLSGLNLFHAVPQTNPGWVSVIFPRVSWRIDSVALMILALLHVPAATGRLRLDVRLSPWLVCGYCAYLVTLLIALTRV